MSGSGAEIVPFPPRAKATAGPLVPDAPERLRIALERLNAAVAAQREAVADWRRAIDTLDGSVARLGASVAQYQRTLSGIAPPA